jgi:hypothetical protein
VYHLNKIYYLEFFLEPFLDPFLEPFLDPFLEPFLEPSFEPFLEPFLAFLFDDFLTSTLATPPSIVCSSNLTST